MHEARPKNFQPFTFKNSLEYCLFNFKWQMFFSRRMPFPGGRIIGAREESDTREGNQHPHMDDSGECHWIPIFVGVLFLIIMITVIMIYKCLVSNLIFAHTE